MRFSNDLLGLGSHGPGKLPENWKIPKSGYGRVQKRSFGPKEHKASCTGATPFCQKRFWVVQRTFRRPLLPGSKIDTEYDRAKVPPYNGNDPPPAPGSLKTLMYKTRERKGYKRGTARNFLHSFPLSEQTTKQIVHTDKRGSGAHECWHLASPTGHQAHLDVRGFVGVAVPSSALHS